MSATVGKSIDKAVVESIDAALTALGPSTRDSVLAYLRAKYSISLEETPHKINEFVRALHSFLGNGARVIEKLIIARLVEMNKVTLADARGKNLVEILNPPGKGQDGPRLT